MKWLCAHLPRLSLDALRRREPAGECLATLESRGSRRWIHDRDDVAAALGVKPGMRLDTAYALAPRLRAVPRDSVGECRLLELTALQAWQLSDRVALEPPDRVLVEVARSRRLLAGGRPLPERFSVPDTRLAFSLAPTPRAAVLLARSGHYRAVRALTRLDGIALRHAELDEETRAALTGVGVTRLGQLRALPRDGLRRRFGPAVLAYLDRLTGRRPDPLTWFTPPERFDGALDLLEETDRAEALLFGASRLLRELGAFLEARDVAIQRFELELEHAHGERTTLAVGLAEPDRAPERLIGLLRERMSHLALPAPVRRLQLSAPRLVAFGSVNGDLFAGATGPGQHAWAQLLERLRARLGTEAVRELATVADHAPEQAWVSRPLAPGAGTPASTGAGPAGAERPLWLLRVPERIALETLVLESGPERIETGWWEDRDIARDYYLARDVTPGREGRRLWIYRDCRGDRGWYVHGLFA